MVRSVGWYEGKSFPCRWYFDLESDESLVVCYGADGEGFVGQIHHANIEENKPPNTAPTTTILRTTPREGPSLIRNIRPEDLNGSSGFGVGETRSTPLRPGGKK